MVLTTDFAFARATAFLGQITSQNNVAVVEFTLDHWLVAVDAFDRYGKGRHPAKLNSGDWMIYTVAQVRSEPLLSNGDDFGRTDVRVHPASAMVSG